MKEFNKTKVICIKSGSKLYEARELMKQNRIRHLPVLDANDEIIAMLSSHDLTDSLKLQDMPVDLFAKAPVSYATESTPLRTVALMILENKISSVLLTDDTLNVTGIITTDDLIYHLTELLRESDEKKGKPWTEFDILVTAGEFFRKLSDIGI